MAEFIPQPAVARRVTLHSVREDIHIHAPYLVIRERLLAIAKHDEWLADHFHDYEAGDGELEFTLVLPGHSQAGRLQVDDSDQFGVRYHRDENGNGSGEIEEISWALHVETAQDAHLTVEAVYQPRKGLLGPLFEIVVLRSQRTQALRESLWNLKRLIEREYERRPIF
ncbi:MAG: hypothetical protein HOH95_09575 [Dehalococcoidia bacterium]|nr:hypothetical protein [Dehalococcoidia bacterium]